MDAAQIEKRFAATEPRFHGSSTLFALIAVGVGAVVGLGVFGPQTGLAQPLVTLLPLSVLMVLMLLGWTAGRRQRRVKEAILKAWQHIHLEDWGAARAILDNVMSRPIRSSAARGQGFIMLAMLAERERCYDCAAQIYETLLLRRIGDPIHLQQAQIALAETKVRNQELTDAVTLIGRLEKVPMPRSLRAVQDLVRLFQQVFMGQYEDAVEDIDARRSLFRRHLSTRAGYGYGLLAAAMHHLGRRREAAALWRDATTLIKPDRLIREYELLSPLVQAYPATEHPL